MRRIGCGFFLRSVVLLAFLNISFSSAHGANIGQRRSHSAADFSSWMSGTSSGFDPSSPDNWLGGMGNWSNPADWSAGEPGGSSDVFINTGNDNVTLDVNASINSLTLGGTSGSSVLTGNGDSLTIAGALTINQTGSLAFGGALLTAAPVMNEGDLHLSNAALIQATNFTNAGSILLNSALGVTASGTFTNSGMITGLDNVDSVSGATLNNSGGLTVYSVSSSGTLTNTGVINVQYLNVQGDLVNMGTVQGLAHGTQVTVNGQLANSGTFDTSYGNATVGSLDNLATGLIRLGQLAVGGNATNAGSILEGSLFEGFADLAVNGTFTNEPTGSVYLMGPDVGGLSASSIVNQGTIQMGQAPLTAQSLTNSGTIATGVGGGSSSISVSGRFTNSPGGVLSLGGMSDTATFGSVTNAGSITVANGATLTVPPSSHATGNALAGFLNSGIVQIASGGTISSLGKYTQTSGQTTIDGLLQGSSNFAGGAVYGNGGTIQGNVTSNAAFNMGDMPMTIGTMAITGNYTQGTNGSLAFDIASLTSYDQLNINGHANLNGTLYVDLLNGYLPQIGNMFDIVNFSGSSGTFSMVLGLPINNNEHFVLEYNSTNLTLDVVSGPDNLPTSGHANGNAYYYEPYISEVMQGANFGDLSGAAPASSVPEPGSIMLLLSGIAGIAGLRRKIAR